MTEQLPDYYQLLFTLITEAVFADGGDGDAFIECRLFSKEVVSNAFGEYLKANKINHLSKIASDHSVNYTDMSNENFIFFDKKDCWASEQIPSWTTIRVTV